MSVRQSIFAQTSQTLRMLPWYSDWIPHNFQLFYLGEVKVSAEMVFPVIAVQSKAAIAALVQDGGHLLADLLADTKCMPWQVLHVPKVDYSICWDMLKASGAVENIVVYLVAKLAWKAVPAGLFGSELHVIRSLYRHLAGGHLRKVLHVAVACVG